MRRGGWLWWGLGSLAIVAGYAWVLKPDSRRAFNWKPFTAPPKVVKKASVSDPRVRRLVDQAKSQIGVTVDYDPAYVRLDYPMGDVPIETGVCTDVVVRALRATGVDLQQRVHEDMKANFGKYPRKWSLKRPDPNIDHRRVPNLETYLIRKKKGLPVVADPERFKPGDIITWKIRPSQDHIGIVSDEYTEDGKTLAVIHNWGAGTLQDDSLLRFEIRGHFRFFQDEPKTAANPRATPGRS